MYHVKIKKISGDDNISTLSVHTWNAYGIEEEYQVEVQFNEDGNITISDKSLELQFNEDDSVGISVSAGITVEVPVKTEVVYNILNMANITINRNLNVFTINVPKGGHSTITVNSDESHDISTIIDSPILVCMIAGFNKLKYFSNLNTFNNPGLSNINNFLRTLNITTSSEEETLYVELPDGENNDIFKKDAQHFIPVDTTPRRLIIHSSYIQ